MSNVGGGKVSKRRGGLVSNRGVREVSNVGGGK